MAGAPVCTVPTQAPTDQPKATIMPAIPNPSPSIAGLMATVVALKRAVETMNQSNNAGNGTGGINGFTLNPGDPSKKTQKQPTWVEINRTKETVRVFNPNDSSQYVDVERINKIVWRDTVTGELFTWTR